MVAQFPNAVRAFSPKVDLSDTVMADHVNALQEEVSAIENTLSTGILSSATTGAWTGSTTLWTNLDARISNIELGLVNGVTPSPYVSITGGGVIQNPDASVGLVLKTVDNAGTGNLLESRNYANTLGFTIDYSGYPYVNGSPVLYVNSTAYNNLVALITSAQGTANAASAANSLHPFLLAGM